MDNIESEEITRALAEEVARIADANTPVTKGMMEAAMAEQYEKINQPDHIVHWVINSVSLLFGDSPEATSTSRYHNRTT